MKAALGSGGVSSGSQLKITFKAGSIEMQQIDSETADALCHFGLMDGQVLSIDENNRAIIKLVVNSRCWGDESVRAFVVTAREAFSLEWLQQQLSGGLESVEVL